MTRSRIRSAPALPVAGLLLATGRLAGCGNLTPAADPSGTRQPAPQAGHSTPAGPRLQDPPELVSHNGLL
ncbi:hypothetical protein ABZ357_40340 [Streptomyces sp. NPDC005917]|uniref:hypothetical protein n=1 Tax=unclassified Streptomyces TaxID=2593676 RepID=UPI0033C086F2